MDLASFLNGVPWRPVLVVAALISGAWIAGRAAVGLILTRTGLRWDWIMLLVLVPASLRYGVPLFTPEPGDQFRVIMWGLGVLGMAAGGRMAHEQRAKIVPEAIVNEALRDTATGEQAPFDWHQDVARYQVSLVLFALGLTLLQMSGK